MGWSEPPPLRQTDLSSFGGSGPPIRAPTAERHRSLVIPDHQYRTEAASKKFHRKLSLRGPLMDSQSPPSGAQDTHSTALAAALAALEGSPPTPSTPTSPLKFPDLDGLKSTDTSRQKQDKMLTEAKRSSRYPTVTEINQLDSDSTQTCFPKNSSHLDSSSLMNENGRFISQKERRQESPGSSVDIQLPDTRDVSPRRMGRKGIERPSLFPGEDVPRFGDISTIKSSKTPNQINSGALNDPIAALPGTPIEEQILLGITDVTPRKMKRTSAKRISYSKENDIPEIGEVPMINFQNNPSQADPVALDETLAALEGTYSPRQENHGSVASEITPRRIKRTSIKRVSMFLEDDIPEVGEPDSIIPNDAPAVPDRSPARKTSAEYTMDALDVPALNEANVGKPRRRDAAARSRKTMSMNIETGTGFKTSHAANQFPEPRSFFDTDAPEMVDESKSRKLKRMSWNVMGRVMPQLQQTDNSSYPYSDQESSSASRHVEPTPRKPVRASWLPMRRGTPEASSNPNHKMATSLACDQPTRDVQAPTRVEPVRRTNNRSSWYSMDPTVAEIQCSPRKEYGPPPPWLEPVAQSTRPGDTGSGTARKSKRASWYSVARIIPPEAPRSRNKLSPAVPDVPEESAEEAKLRKKNNRMSRSLLSQEPKKRFLAEGFPQLNGPLNSHPTSCTSSRPQTPRETPHVSRMKRLGVQIGRFFR